MALFDNKIEEKADPKVQIEQSIQAAKEQHQELSKQAAAVIGNQRQLEMSDGRRTWQLHDLGKPVGGEDLFLVIGNTGVHAPTAAQVAKVAAAIKLEPERMKEIETIGTIARRGIAALKRGDYEAVGRAMTENQVMLRGLGVSCPELDALVRAAAPSSLGAKLTGAGGGGCEL